MTKKVGDEKTVDTLKGRASFVYYSKMSFYFRWITVASGALRLYFQTSHPSLGLRKFVAFIIQVYAPVSFSIRKDGHVTNGSRHFFNLIRAGLDHLKTIKERELFKESILNNNFFR